jgi:hypothetical protein
MSGRRYFPGSARIIFSKVSLLDSSFILQRQSRLCATKPCPQLKSWQRKRTKIRSELTFPLTHAMPL